MKSTSRIVACSLIFVSVISCGGGGGGGGTAGIANFVSQVCNTVVGPTALYWDYANALPVPLTSVPILQNPGSQFIHSQYPALGFPVPQGYTGFEVLNQQTATIGVNVVRSDNAVVWRYVPSSTFEGAISITDVMAFEINQMLGFYQFSGALDVLCTETRTVVQNGITTVFSARLIQFGNVTGLVWANTHFVQSLGITFVTSSVSAGPSSEYNDLVMNIFLPLSFQLLVTGGSERDSDLDGVPDSEDADPFNPNVQ